MSTEVETPEITEAEAPEVKTDERIIMERRQAEIDDALQEVETLAELANDVLTEFKALNLGQLSAEEISQLIQGATSIKEIAQNRIVGDKAVKIAGLNLNLSQVKEMVELPDISGAEAAVRYLKSRIESDRKRNTYSKRFARLSDLSIIDGLAAISDEAAKSIVDQYTTYAETDQDKEIYALAKQAQETLQQLYDKHGVMLIENESDGRRNVLRQTVTDYGSGKYKATIEVHTLKRKMDQLSGRIRY